jgi:elongation factor Ts
MAITAADVKRLRDLTAAGMMDSKLALEEADGDFEKAVEILRVKGAAKAQKRGAERTASAGLVAASGPALVELNSETDFVAKSEEFVAAAQRIAEAAAAGRPADAAELKGLPLGDGTVGEAVEALAVRIGEKIELGRVAVFDEPVVVYLHRRAADLPPAVGVLVQYEGDDAARGGAMDAARGAEMQDAARGAAMQDAARGAAMQIAAMRPSYVSRDEVPADVVAKEREIAEATARAENKPEQALPRIVEGRLNAFFKDVALLDQPSVTEPKRSVRAVLDDAGVRVVRFARFEVGA